MSNYLSKSKKKSIVTLFITACLVTVFGVASLNLSNADKAVADASIVFETKASSFNEISHWNGSQQATYTISETNGVNVKFDSITQEFLYNESIDITQFNGNQKFINFYVNPLGDRNVQIYVDLIDTADEANYVSVKINSKDGSSTHDSSLLACVPSIGQQYTGKFLFNDAVRINSTAGTRKYSNITVSDSTNTTSYAPVHFSYDNTSKQIALTIGNNDYTGTRYTVADLDDTTTSLTYYLHDGTIKNTAVENGTRTGYFDTAWGGFSGNTVNVRIRVEGTVSTTTPVEMYLTEIAGAEIDATKCTMGISEAETCDFGTEGNPISHWNGVEQVDYVITETNGVNFTFDRESKEFYYKKPIDVTKIGGNQKFINFYVNPLGDRNVQIYVDLIDTADEANYVSVKINSKDGSSTHDSSLLACVPSIGQQYTGKFLFNDAVRINSTAGTRKYSNITVSNSTNTTSYAPVHFSYDNTSKQIALTIGNNDYTGTRYTVADLDDTTTSLTYYLHDGTVKNTAVENGTRTGYFDTAWGGFSGNTVNVRIRVEGSDVSEEKPVQIYITDIGGVAIDKNYAATREGITYELDGGTNSNKNPKYLEGVDAILYDAEKEGYGFEGWYTSPSFESTSKIVKIDKSMTQAPVLYARFIEVEERYLAKPSAFNDITHSGGTYQITQTNGLNLMFDHINMEYVYTKPIPIAKFDGTQAFIHFYVNTLGDRNLSLYVDLIDTANAENYLSVKFGSKYGTTQDSYVAVAVPSVGQVYTGKEVGSDILHINDGMGTRKYSNITLSNASNTTAYGALHFAYDDATKQVFVTAGDTAYAAERNLVADLDNVEYFSSTWAGFNAETVSVRIRVEGSVSNTQPVEVYVTEIGGEKLNPLYSEVADGITYVVNGGENDYRNPKNYFKADKIALYPASKVGLVFAGWYTTADFQENSRVTEIGGGATGALTLYAKFAEGADIEYHLNGGTNNPNNPTQYCVGEQTILYPASKEGYAFKGWYITENFAEYTNLTSIANTSVGKVTLYAKFSKISTVSYDIADGNNDGRNLNEYIEGDGLPLYPANKAGYLFVGWYMSADFSANSKVTEISPSSTGNITLYAKFATAGTITYVLNGGYNHTNNAEQYAVGTGLTLGDASKQGCVFLGWYTSADFSASSKVTEISATATGDITLYAYFITTSNITYIVGTGASNPDNPLTYVEGTTVALQAAMKEGYSFEGWYTTEDFRADSKVESITADMKGDITLYGKFVEIEEKGGTKGGCSSSFTDGTIPLVGGMLVCVAICVGVRKRKHNENNKNQGGFYE